MSKLPNNQKAIIPIKKLRDYCLNLEHPFGKNKAVLFRRLLNLTELDAEYLRQTIFQAIKHHEAYENESDEYGRRFVVDFPLERNSRNVYIRTAWIIKLGENSPRLTSCYIK